MLGVEGKSAKTAIIVDGSYVIMFFGTEGEMQKLCSAIKSYA